MLTAGQNTLARTAGRRASARAPQSDVEPGEAVVAAPLATLGPVGQGIAGGSAIALAHYFAHNAFGDPASFDVAGVLPAGIAVALVGAVVAILL